VITVLSIFGELDDLDLEILRLLQINARLSYRKIAERLGVSPATILVRLRRLKKKGIVKGFTVEIDPYKLGYQSLAYMLLKVDPRKLRKVISRFMKEPYIVEIYEITGDYHLLIKLWARDPGDLANIIDRIRLIDGVNDTNTLYVLKINKESKNPI